MLEYSLNILGSEWIIIIFVALLALLGTNKLPEVTKKLGRAVGEYNKTKTEIQNQLSGITNANLNVTSPVQNERQKLEFIAKWTASTGCNLSNQTQLIWW
jgi:sec-independent protein translocase protein TatA